MTAFEITPSHSDGPLTDVLEHCSVFLMECSALYDEGTPIALVGNTYKLGSTPGRTTLTKYKKAVRCRHLDLITHHRFTPITLTSVNRSKPFIFSFKDIQKTFNMQFTIATIAVFAAVALAAPASVERKIPLCFSGRPLCCATDVLNVANLNCEARKSSPFVLQ